MIQSVEKLPDIHFHQPAATQVHHLLPQGRQRLMRRPSRPETVRAVQEVLLVNRLQRHHDRPLKDFILQRRDAQGPGFTARPFGNAHAPHRRCPVRAGLSTVQKRLQVVPQGQPVVVGRLSVHARCPVFAGSVVGCDQPDQVQVVVERREPQLWLLLRQLCYPLAFREHGIRLLSTGHVSLQRFRNPTPPSLHRVPAGRVPRLQRYYEVFRFPADLLAALRWCFAWRYHPVRLCSCLRPGPTPTWGLELCGLAAPASMSRWSRRASQVPGEPCCAYAVFFDPGGTHVPGLLRHVNAAPGPTKPKAHRG